MYFFFDQNKQIWLILKIKKLENTEFVQCTLIIQKTEIRQSIRPTLKSHSTSFMFNNIFCEMNIKKVIHYEGPGGMGEPS